MQYSVSGGLSAAARHKNFKILQKNESEMKRQSSAASRKENPKHAKIDHGPRDLSEVPASSQSRVSSRPNLEAPNQFLPRGRVPIESEPQRPSRGQINASPNEAVGRSTQMLKADRTDDMYMTKLLVENLYNPTRPIPNFFSSHSNELAFSNLSSEARNKVINLKVALNQCVETSDQAEIANYLGSLFSQIQLLDGQYSSRAPTPESLVTSSLGQVVTPALVTPWTVATLSKGTPPLPPIRDSVLELATFTHHGVGSGQGTDLNYERLEWVGDSYIYSISTLLISQAFPNLLPGKSAQLRETLVKNQTLAEYAAMYRFQERARLPAELNLGGNSRERTHTKVMADIFEAYVAAVVLSDPQAGLARVIEWLKALWGTTIEKDIIKEERKGFKLFNPMWNKRRAAANNTDQVATTPTSIVNADSETVHSLNAKERLQRLIGTKGVKLVYKDAGPERKDEHNKLPIFTVGVFLTGYDKTDEMIGRGSAHGKKEAGMKAAQDALSKNSVRSLVERKLMIDAMLERERELAGN